MLREAGTRMTEQSVDVKNNAAANRFEVRDGEHVAVAEYELRGGKMVFTHTEVPPEMSGRGIANHLAKSGLDHARAEKLKVVPLCAFIASYIKRHGEYQDLVATE
jgi:predicted GNAT family acetyltransferase